MAENETSIVDFEIIYHGLPVFTVLFILGAASNTLLIIAFIKDPLHCFRNSGTYLVMNLSVSDCLMCMACLFNPWLNLNQWMVEFFVNFFGIASFLSIASISIDRFIIVAYPVKHRILFKENVRNTVSRLAFIWLGSLIHPIIGIWYERRRSTYILAEILTISSVFLYVCTYYKLKKQMRNLAHQNDSTESRAQKIRILKEKCFLNTIILIALVAFVSTIPFMIFYEIYNSLGSPKQTHALKILYKVVSLLFYANFTVNPLIYTLRLSNYRKTFLLLYCCRRNRDKVILGDHR